MRNHEAVSEIIDRFKSLIREAEGHGLKIGTEVVYNRLDELERVDVDLMHQEDGYVDTLYEVWY